MITKLESRLKDKKYNVRLWADGIRKLEWLAKHYRVTKTAIFQEGVELLYESAIKKQKK